MTTYSTALAMKPWSVSMCQWTWWKKLMSSTVQQIHSRSSCLDLRSSSSRGMIVVMKSYGLIYMRIRSTSPSIMMW